MTTLKYKHDPQRTSETSPKAEQLDAFTNTTLKKNKPETIPTKPQADEILNPDLNSENDL